MSLHDEISRLKAENERLRAGLLRIILLGHQYEDNLKPIKRAESIAHAIIFEKEGE